MTAEIVTLPFRPTLADYRRQWIFSGLRAPFVLPLGPLPVFYLFYLPFSFVGYEINAETWPRFLLYVLGLAGALLLLMGGSLWFTLSRLKSRQNALSTRRVHLNASHVRFEGDDFTEQLTWQVVRHIAQNRTAIYLFNTMQTRSYMILKSAFATPAAAQAFFETAKGYIAAGRRKRGITVDEVVTTPMEGLVSPPHAFTLHRFLIVNYGGIFSRPYLKLPVAALLVATGVWIDFFTGYGGPADDLVGVVVVLAAMYILMFIGMAVGWLLLRNSPQVTGGRRVGVTPESIRVAAPGFDITVAWQDMRKVCRRDGEMLFFPKGSVPIAVPISAFLFKAEAEAFYRQALGYFEAAQKR